MELEQNEGATATISHISTNLINRWYPIIKSGDVGRKKPVAVRLFGQPLALYRDKQGAIQSVADLCPHKSTKLSVGRVIDGTLECFYHGWQFDINGQVTHMPGQNPKKSIPKGACVKIFKAVDKHGLVWIFRGNYDDADETKIHYDACRENKRLSSAITIIDVPCDHTYFVENLTDAAHTPFVHDGMFNRRSDATPLTYKLKSVDNGLEAEVLGSKSYGKENQLFLKWEAPCTNIVRVFAKYFEMHLIIHSIPTGPGQMRLILTSYRNFGFLDKLPNWMIWKQRFGVPWQDYVAILPQQRNVSEGAKPVNVPMECDFMAILYRRWYEKAFKSKDVWWKGWDGNLDIEDLRRSAIESMLGGYQTGAYERRMIESRDAGPLYRAWRQQNHKLGKRGYFRWSTLTAAALTFMSTYFILKRNSK